jgi:pyruvate,orthophosphate dikinase
MLGSCPTIQPELVGDFGVLMEWADAKRRLRVRTNAETPHDCRTAREFGAEGHRPAAGTEHMFFEPGRVTAVRQMILAETRPAAAPRSPSCSPSSAATFAEIFRIMHGLPVTIRLLDPPLHEFLPTARRSSRTSRRPPGVDVETLAPRAGELHEFNPMLGHRGCRLGITYPEIYEMQARAIFEAAVEVARKASRRCPK